MPLSSTDLRRFALQDDPVEAMGVRGKVLAAISRSSFRVAHIVDRNKYASPSSMQGGDTFGLILKPNQTASTLYGLDREVLLWCSTYPTFQARDIEALRRELETFASRLSRQFVVLVTDYDPSRRNAFESEGDLDETIVHVSINELLTEGLDSVLSSHLYSRDIFDVRGATVKAADFFGRRELIDRLVSEIETGTSQTGIFGLRKIGKTSLLNRIADKLRNTGKVNVARLDLQWTTSINPNAEYTLWAIGESIYASHRSVRAVGEYRLFGKARTFSDLSEPSAVWELFAHDIGVLLSATKRNTCLLIDEIERLYEAPIERGFVRIWRLLRGLDQQHPGRLRYVVGGTSPHCAELGTVEGEDNPLFNYLSLGYLAPLTKQDARTLLTNLGSAMGLQFAEDALDWAFRECGGHPALLRSLGSSCHQRHLHRTEPVEITDAELRASSVELGQRNAATLDQMVASLEDGHPDEFELLSVLARGDLYQFREYASTFPSEVAHLRNYGLLSDLPVPHIPIRELHTHLVRRFNRPKTVQDEAETLHRGTPIGPWQVDSRLSAGAFAKVYSVHSMEEPARVAAAKVLQFGQLSSLQREVDVLKEMEHPQIVRVYDAMLTEDDSPCLIMELLEGKELSHYCSPSTFPGIAVWRDWMLALLSALEFMHPKTSLVRALEAKESLSSEEYSAWDHAKHGYVHRDIKPENIIVTTERGPVLIDFNISVRAGAPVQTVSATPGYRPNISPTWSPAVDLYALAVTFLELAAGCRISTTSLDDLAEVASQNLPNAAMVLVGRMLGAGENGMTAGEALLETRRLGAQLV